MEIIKQLYERIIGAKPQTFELPDGAAGVVHIVAAPPGWHQLRSIENKANKFPRVYVDDIDSMCAYIKRFEGPNHAYLAGERGIVAYLDYAIGNDARPLGREHCVEMLADWAPEFKPAVSAILAACGKPQRLDVFEALVQTAALAIRNSTSILEAIADLEGVEVVKARRSQTGHLVQVGGDVKSREGVSIPRTIELSGVYMGRIVSALVPFRVTVDGGNINFTLVNDGSVAAATSQARDAVYREFAERVHPAVLLRGVAK